VAAAATKLRTCGIVVLPQLFSVRELGILDGLSFHVKQVMQRSNRAYMKNTSKGVLRGGREQLFLPLETPFNDTHITHNQDMLQILQLYFHGNLAFDTFTYVDAPPSAAEQVRESVGI
jgi:hypothetical protein